MGLGSGIRDPEKPIPDWIQGPKRHQILDPDPQHCIFRLIFVHFRSLFTMKTLVTNLNFP
jgi:hypothetical protein